MSIVSLALDRTSGATAIDILNGPVVNSAKMHSKYKMRSETKRLCRNLGFFGVAGGLDHLSRFWVLQIFGESRELLRQQAGRGL